MTSAEDASTPAALVHDRRVQARKKQKSIAIKPDCCWRAHSNSKCVKEEVLPLVKQGVVLAAEKFRITIGDDDLKWLDDHNGRFMHHAHPGGSNCRMRCLAVG
jgi:hypothetical protein